MWNQFHIYPLHLMGHFMFRVLVYAGLLDYKTNLRWAIPLFIIIITIIIIIILKNELHRCNTYTALLSSYSVFLSLK